MFHFVNPFQKFGVKRMQHKFSMFETLKLGKDSSAPPRIVPQKEGNRFENGDWSPSFLSQCKRNKVSTLSLVKGARMCKELLFSEK